MIKIKLLVVLVLLSQCLVLRAQDGSLTLLVVPKQTLERLEQSILSYNDLVLQQKLRQKQDLQRIERLLIERETLSRELLENIEKSQRQAKELVKAYEASLRKARLLSILGWTTAGISGTALFGVLIWVAVK